MSDLEDFPKCVFESLVNRSPLDDSAATGFSIEWIDGASPYRVFFAAFCLSDGSCWVQREEFASGSVEPCVLWNGLEPVMRNWFDRICKRLESVGATKGPNVLCGANFEGCYVLRAKFNGVDHRSYIAWPEGRAAGLEDLQKELEVLVELPKNKLHIEYNPITDLAYPPKGTLQSLVEPSPLDDSAATGFSIEWIDGASPHRVFFAAFCLSEISCWVQREEYSLIWTKQGVVQYSLWNGFELVTRDWFDRACERLTSVGGTKAQSVAAAYPEYIMGSTQFYVLRIKLNGDDNRVSIEWPEGKAVGLTALQKEFEFMLKLPRNKLHRLTHVSWRRRLMQCFGW